MRYVVNLHLLEQCNYRCKHCFAHFDSGTVLSVRDWKAIIDNITESIAVSRFNLAGGEPLLYPGLDELIEYINAKDSAVSLITNGYLLSEDRIKNFGGNVAMIGLSIDALEPELLIKLGRCTQNQNVLDPKRCIALCKRIQKKRIPLKINTVVSKLNLNEDFTGFMRTIRPDRWKLLKMKRFSDKRFDNSALEVSDSEFSRFCAKHKAIPHISEVSLKNAYIMVDAGGRLVDNTGDTYTAAADLLREDFQTGFKTLRFDAALYESRYRE